MEEKKLNEKESLELITRMMQNTKINLEVGSGNSLIIWGVSTLIANIIVFILLYFTESPMSFWAWMAVPVIGTIWTKLASNSKAKVTTKIDKMVSNLFRSILYISILLPIAFVTLVNQAGQELIISGYNLMTLIPFAEVLLVSIGLIANAIIIDFKPLRVGGLVGATLSLAMLCNSLYIHTFIFGIWAIVSMIIPGIKLNYYIKSKKNV